MPTIDDAKRQLHLKTVYAGPGLAGKTTNLQYVFARTDPAARTRMASIATATSRLLSFSLTPRTLAPVRGLEVVLDLVTVPGAVYYDVSRMVSLEHADGIVFVADSQIERMDANVESLDDLCRHLAAAGRDPDRIPMTLQYNKRDLPNAAALEDLDAALNRLRRARLPAIASAGEGVFDTLRDCAGQMVRSLA